MRALRRLVWGGLASFLMVGASPATVQADVAHLQHGAYDCPIRHRAPITGSTSAPPSGLQNYYRGDWRLGPSYLPKKGPIARMLRGWHPQDATSQYWFLGCYWGTNQQNQSSWWYPDNNGFLLSHGRPVEWPKKLDKGQLVDLFGRGTGNFLAPIGTPYAKRAIPPTNLDEYSTSAPPFNYHLYRVIKPFVVHAGPIRPWFGQPGLGMQYMTSVPIPHLVASKNLEEINWVK